MVGEYIAAFCGSDADGVGMGAGMERVRGGRFTGASSSDPTGRAPLLRIRTPACVRARTRYAATGYSLR